jgi:DNA-binding MarR family transcriptional regulator
MNNPERFVDATTSEPGGASLHALATQLRIAVGGLKRRLRDKGNLGELTWSQLSALGHLERDGPATVTKLAKAEGVRPQSMGATIAALQAAGLVAGTPHPDDGRQTVLSLTDACRAWIDASRAAREDWLCSEIEAKLSTEEQQTLAAAVALMRRLGDA